jgi:hypothetical protein
MSDILQRLLSGTDPILMEVGATARPEENWDEIAPWSTYCGFGPALQILDTPELARYHNRVVFNEIVVPDADAGAAPFYETKDPIFSSLLEPDSEAIANHCDLRDVVVEKISQVRTAAISELLSRASISRIDWFKTNINGADARLYDSLAASVRSRLLAVETVLDFVPLYRQQDKTLLSHPKLLQQGFWLSRLTNWGGVRMRAESAAELQKRGIPDPYALLSRHHRRSPGWSFARYFRTLESLEQGEFSARDYCVLWSFAWLDGQLGFCTDLALGYQKRFGADDKSGLMLEDVARRIQRLEPARPTLAMRVARKLLPSGIRNRLRTMMFGR